MSDTGAPWQRVTTGAVLLLWLVALVFFALVAVAAVRATGPAAPITDLRGALITAAYSARGAVVLFGAAAVVLPADRPALGWAFLGWCAVTALLIWSGQVSGTPLLAAALVASGIALDVIRRLWRAVRLSGARP